MNQQVIEIIYDFFKVLLGIKRNSKWYVFELKDIANDCTDCQSFAWGYHKLSTNLNTNEIYVK